MFFSVFICIFVSFLGAAIHFPVRRHKSVKARFYKRTFWESSTRPIKKTSPKAAMRGINLFDYNALSH